MEACVEAFLQINPDLPINFDLSSRQDYAEVRALQALDAKFTETALSPYFYDPRVFWENAVTLLSVYTQKAIEEQDKEKIGKAIKACELMLQRFENQLSIEKEITPKNYAYPSTHNLASLKLMLADARSQLKTLDEAVYEESINLCLDGIALYQELELGGLVSSGADYFSISKALITIADLKVRIAQIRVRSAQSASEKGDQAEADKYFNQADNIFREAEAYYQAVANLDAGKDAGLRVDAKVTDGRKLSLDVKIPAMLASWSNNQSKGYIRDDDRKRGFQGTLHFLKALASIKIQGAFLENPTKRTEDYKMEKLFERLTLLQNSLAELTRDQNLETDFLEGLANIIKLNLLVMIGDRAQFDTISMDRASALNYFNKLLDEVGKNIPELIPAVKKLQINLIEEEAALLITDRKYGKPAAINMLAALEAQTRPNDPQLADVIVNIKRLAAAGTLTTASSRPERTPTIDDNLLVDMPVTPFAHTASISKRFALIIVQLTTVLALEAYTHSQPPAGKNKPRFPYLFMLSNLALAEVGVRIFFITERPFKPVQHLVRISTAKVLLEPEDHWYRFIALYLEGNLHMLESLPEEYKTAETFLLKALEELKKFIHPSQVFYKAQIYLLLAQAYNQLGKESIQYAKKAEAAINKLRNLIPEIETISPQIGWNLKDFYVRYSRVVINYIARSGPVEREKRGFH